MKIRVLSDKKIMVKNVHINVIINAKKYDSISRDAKCKKSKDDYMEFDLYTSTQKSDHNLVKHISKLYGIKMKYIYKRVEEYKVLFGDTDPKRMTYIRYVSSVQIIMPETYYNNWLIRQRDEKISKILYGN